MAELNMTHVKCDNCGMDIDLDACSVETKRRLNKDVFCALCRNKKVAREFDLLEPLPPEELYDLADVGDARKKFKPVQSMAFF